MASFILGAAIRAVKSRIGIWKAYDAISDIVPEVTRQEWAQAVGDARASLAQRVSELTRPLNRRPVTGEFGADLKWSVRGQFVQFVEIHVRDRETGARSTFHHRLVTDTLRSRMAVIRDGLDKIQAIIDADPDRYPVDIVSVDYTGTNRAVGKG